MEILENLVEVGSQLSFVQEFYGFTEEIHKMIGCKETECDLSKFFTPMKDVIYDSNKDYDYKKKKFLLQAIKFPNIFNAMFQLKNKRGKEQAQNLIEGLKSLKVEKLNKEQERITEQIDILVNKISESTKPTDK